MNPKPIIIFAAVLLLTVGVAAAVVYIKSNNVNVNPQATPTPTPSPTLTLTANTTTPLVGESIRLQAVISTHQQGIAVTFYANGTPAYTSGTNSEGIAIYETAPLSSTTPLIYYADCNLP